MKFSKYTGLYFVMLAIGSNVLRMTEANEIWTALFYGGAVIWYIASMQEKDS